MQVILDLPLISSATTPPASAETPWRPLPPRRYPLWQTQRKARRLLGISTRYEMDGFLKQHGVALSMTIKDIGRDLEEARRFDGMKLVVADTSPVNYLVLIRNVDVLRALFQQVLIPSRVFDELSTRAIIGPSS